MSIPPLKRDASLIPLSREHHYALLLCWKIKTGFLKKVEPERIKKYADWFYLNHLIPHFEMEEKYIFPILGNENDLIKKALSEHSRLKEVFQSDTDIEKNLLIIESELEAHIRFEERILFNEIQTIASAQQLQLIQENHPEENFADNFSDPFWAN